MKNLKINWIVDTLQKSEYKLTVSRLKIAKWIDNHAGIFSVSELQKKLPCLDKVSVYRTIDLLASLDVIHPVLIQHGEQHYEMHTKSHHHHAVCEFCEMTKCIKCTIAKNKSVRGFRTIHHTLVLTGICTKCAGSHIAV